MALTNSSRFFRTSIKDLSCVLADFKRHFEDQGYDVTTEPQPAGAFLSITKGNTFKSIVGMKTALNIDIDFVDNGVEVSMQVGAFGQRILPAAITMFVAWPVMIPQIMGLVQQNKLDTEAYDVIEAALHKYEGNPNMSEPSENEFNFCVNCGAKNAKSMTFCPKCGAKLTKEEPPCEELHCVNCGKVILPGTAFCTSCGAKQ